MRPFGLASLLSNMHRKFLHLFSWLLIVLFIYLFFGITELFVWMYHRFSLTHLFEENLDCFQVLATMNKIAINIYVQVSVLT